MKKLNTSVESPHLKMEFLKIVTNVTEVDLGLLQHPRWSAL